VLAVRDNKLDVEDSDNVSSEVAEGAGRCGKARGSVAAAPRAEPARASPGSSLSRAEPWELVH